MPPSGQNGADQKMEAFEETRVDCAGLLRIIGPPSMT